MDNGHKEMISDIEKFVCKGACDKDDGRGNGDTCVFGCPFYRLISKLNELNEQDKLNEFLGWN